MKRILKHYVIDTFTLYAVSSIATGMLFENGIETLLIAGLGFLGASLLAKPVINLLLLPLNMVTFGIFRWVSSAVVLYLVTLIVPGFKIVSFNFQGLISKWLDIPAVHLEGVPAYIAYALLLSIIGSVLYWIFK